MLGLFSSASAIPSALEEVTAINQAAEVPARELGIDASAVEAVWRAAEQLYRSGIHPALQLCVRHRGAVVLDRALGHAAGNGPGDPAEMPKTRCTPGTLFNVFSASKAVTAMVVHLLDQRKLLHLDDAVAEYVPEFARHDKEGITIRQVLAHRAGVPDVPREAMKLESLEHPGVILELLCEAKPQWRPGRGLGYHAITGGFILAEVVQRVTGRDIRTVLGEEILHPLGFQWTNYGVPVEHVGAVALNYFSGPPLLPPISTIMERVIGLPMPEVIRLSNDPRFLTAIVPAGNVITTANELSRFFQLLLGGGTLDGVEIFDRRTIRRAVAEQSYLEPDLTIGLPMRYSMGFMLGAEWFSIYGPYTDKAFGHVGFTNVIGWADPEREVAAALMTSGKPILYPQLYYLWEILRQIGAACPRTPGRSL